MPDNVITKAALARIFGVSRVQASRWERIGMPVLPDGKLDAVKAERWVRSNVDPGARNARQRRARKAAMAQHDSSRPEPNPTDTLVSLGIWLLAQRIPGAAATAAIKAGLPEPQAREMHEAMRAESAVIAEAVRAMMELPPDAEREPWTLVPSVFPTNAV